MTDMTLQVERRERTGNGPNRQLRAQGKIPAVVYGGGRDSVAIEVDRRALLDLIKKSSGESPVFLLRLGDRERHAMIRDIQQDPVSRQVIHVDFLRVLMDQKVRVQVPVEVVGTPVGVKTEGGMLDFVTREINVECLPGDIPSQIELDVAKLHMGEHVEAGQLALPANVTLLDDTEKVIVSVAGGRMAGAAEEEAEPEAEREEPELIRRKGEEEGAEG
jgi:large subunit ribosomal protein L25